MIFCYTVYDASLEQCLTTSRGTPPPPPKKRGPKFGPNGSKSDPKLGFLSLFQVWVISFPGDCLGG